jgi:hypothetical protein
MHVTKTRDTALKEGENRENSVFTGAKIHFPFVGTGLRLEKKASFILLVKMVPDHFSDPKRKNLFL